MADRGIDLHVCHRNGEVLAAVQVKRRINKEVEGVAEVRNFIGALAVESISKGIFVTTATRYTREAKRVADKLNDGTRSRLELDLIDGGELFEILKTLPRDDKLILPNNIESADIWLDAAGEKHTTRMLLYGY
jgi:restriction endonuclease Mrr